jgi:adenosylcobinamide-GDP ribazoletransferase
MDVEARSFASAQWAAPVAGALVGLVGAAALAAALWLGLPENIVAIAALAATMLVTGALHEDGAADLADGFGGGATRERKLEIMRDSRLGTYGAAALSLSILARIVALAALAANSAGTAVLVLIAAHVAARAPIAAFLMLVQPARADGLSAGVGRIEPTVATVALAIGVIALAISGIAFAVAASLLLTAWFFALKRLCEAQVGGQTGDVLGALEQGGEIVVLLAACAILI